MEIRLQKVMAEAGLGSRRACEELIRNQKVSVNGVVATLGQKVDPRRDLIFVDGKPLGPEEKKRYLILHKPLGYITSAREQFGRPIVLDLLSGLQERVYPVGRLDYDSEGLVFLTNDGELAHKVMHPRYELPKTYLVTVTGRIGSTAVDRLCRGVVLDDGLTAPAQVQIVKLQQNASLLRLTIIEGRNRQIRRMAELVGYPVQRLVRIAIGPLILNSLAPGEHRFLERVELRALRKAVGDGE